MLLEIQYVAICMEGRYIENEMCRCSYQIRSCRGGNCIRPVICMVLTTWVGLDLSVGQGIVSWCDYWSGLLCLSQANWVDVF